MGIFIMFIKILFISTFIFFSSCKPFMTNGGNSGNTSPNPGGPGAPIKPATCAAITDLSKCATAQPQDSTDCAVNHTGLLCVVLPKTCAEILIKDDCPHLKPVCEWQAGNCVNKPGVPPPPPPPPPGDAVKKDELIESITNNPAFDAADLDKFASLDQAQLKDVLAKIGADKDADYKKDLMTKILANNKLKNFIKADQLDDAFIAAFKTADKKDYAFSNALLDAALKDGSGVSKKVQKDVVKKVFAFTERLEMQKTGFNASRQAITLGAYPLATFSQVKFLTMKVKDDKKNELEQKLKKIFELGDEAIDAFYGYMIPQSWPGDDNSNITDKMDYRISSAIINLIVEKKLVHKIITNKDQASKMIQVINRVKDKMKNFDNALAGHILEQIKDVDIYDHFIKEANNA